MKLTVREAKILDYLLEKQAGVTELARDLDLQKSNASRYLKKLEGLKLVSITKTGRNKIILLNDSLKLGFFKARQAFDYIKLNDVLSGSTPFLISFIGSKQSFKLKELDLPYSSAKRLVKNLREQAIIFMKSYGIYEMRQEAQLFAEFCQQQLFQTHLAQAQQELSGINQAYCSFDSARDVEMVFVAKAGPEPKHYYATAYTVFHKYGIQLILTNKNYYTNIKPKWEDAAIHALALGTDARSIAYVSALILKNKFDCGKMRVKKQKFGLKKEFLLNLSKFIESQGRSAFAGFPSWSEVEKIAGS